MNDMDALSFASSASVVELIGDYVVLREVARGGNAVVYACRDGSLGRNVAIKVLHPQLLGDDVTLKRFRREGQVLARIVSPHVAQVFQVGVQRGLPYLVMELVDGPDAESELKHKGALELNRALTVARDVALGLAAAHEAGVIHRDVKPANILLASGGAKITDFGLARQMEGSAQLTLMGEIPGTAAFMPPERARGDSEDHRSDLYALGATLHTLIAGKPPFDTSNPLAAITANLSEPPPRLSVRDDVADLVLSLLAKDPAQRPQTAAEVARRIDVLLAPRKDNLMERLEELLDSEPPPSPMDAAPSGVLDITAINMPPPHAHESAALDASAAVPERAPAAVPERAPAATGVMGSLSRMGLAELLQTLEQSASTACVDLRAADGGSGSVGLAAGRLVFAKARDVEGQDAFFELMRWRSGSFQIHYDRAPPIHNIDAAPQALMLEAFRRMDEVAAAPSGRVSDETAREVAGAPSGPAPDAAEPIDPLDVTLRDVRPPAVVTTSILDRIQPLLAVARQRSMVAAAALQARWRALSARGRLIAAGATGAVALALLVAAFAGGNDDPLAPAPPPSDRRAKRIAAGEAVEVLKELDAIPANERDPEDELVRGHALAATDDEPGALAAYTRAARGGAVDSSALTFVLAAINRFPADDAIAVLVAWPKDAIVPQLERLVAEGDWWERHHALSVLEARKQADNVDVTALAARDLAEGTTCNKRKHGLTLMKERGSGQAALKAIDEASRRSDNNCMWFRDYEAARKSVRGRPAATPAPARDDPR